MKRIAVLLWLVLAGVVAAQQVPDDSRFTGKTVVMDGKDLQGLLTTDNLSEFLMLRRVGMEPAL